MPHRADRFRRRPFARYPFRRARIAAHRPALGVFAARTARLASSTPRGSRPYHGAWFDLRGDTADAGEGKHFGDPSVTIGLDVTYLPARVSVDLGTLLTQRFVEPIIHKGIEANWVLSCQWRF